jgi:hypothetical protein
MLAPTGDIAMRPLQVLSRLRASLADEEDDSDEELAPTTPLATSKPATAPGLSLEGAVCGLQQSSAAVPPGPPAASHLSDGLLVDTTVIVEGLGFLSLPPAASGGLDCEVPFPADMPTASSFLWAGYLSSDEDDGDEVLASQTPLASAKDVVSGSMLGTADVHHAVKVPLEPCGGLFAASATLGGKEDWVQVGRDRRPGCTPSSLLQKEGTERSLAFKRWARGRCFRCLERGHQVSTCRGPFRCIRCHRPGHRERFCRTARSRSPDTCARPSDAYAPCQRSRSPSAQPRPLSSRSWVEVVCHSLLRAAVPPGPFPRCFEDASLDSVF